MWAIDRWRRLTRGEKVLVVRAAASVAVMSLGLRTLGVKRMLQAAQAGETKAADHAEYADVVAAVERAGRYVPGGTCLAQSLGLTWMLRKRGVVARTRVGVQLADGFHAHAWVEVGGTPITSESGHRTLTWN